MSSDLCTSDCEDHGSDILLNTKECPMHEFLNVTRSDFIYTIELPLPSKSRDNVRCVGAISMHVSFAYLSATPTTLISGDDILNVHIQHTLGSVR